MSTTSPYDHEDGEGSNTSTVSTPNFGSHKQDYNGSLNNGSMPKDHTPEKKKATRRSVACKSCHSLKVKCTPADINNPGGPCIRCLNSKRQCEIDLTQPRKRRKKSEKLKDAKSTGKLKDDIPKDGTAMGPNGSKKDSLVVHAPPNHLPPVMAVKATSDDPRSKDDIIRRLQEQVNTLKTELSTQKSNQYPGQFANAYLQHRTESVKSSEIGSPIFISKYDLEKEIITLCESSVASLSEVCNDLKLTTDKRMALLRKNTAVDVISRGVISVEEAEERLQIYKSKIYATHPLVEIPDSLSVDQFRKEKPFLFNAVMSVSNVLYATDPQSLERSLLVDNEAMTSIAVEILVCGTKSSELIFSLLLLSLWYNSPELFRSRRYHLLNTLSVSLLHDVGISSRPTFVYKHNEETISQDVTPIRDSNNLENDSLILILYFTSVSFSLILRRTIYVKWTPYVQECCNKLQKSGIKKWEHLALFLQLNHELERIHNIIHYPDSGDASNPTTKYIVVEFQKNLNDIKAKIEPDDHAFNAYYYSVEAYLHEPILREIVTDKIGDEANVKLGNETINLVAKCTASCLNSLDHFNQMTVESIATIPLFYSARIIYTAGMLLRLRFLILSLPSHIEKDLVPVQTVDSIQKLNKLLGVASTTYETNHFLKKLRLVIQLFIQTYATQVQDLLRKNGETPQNFHPTNVYRFPKKEMNEMERLSQSYTQSESSGLLTTETGRQFRSNLPLDLLSYAAAVRSESSRSGSLGEEDKPPVKPATWPDSKTGNPINDDTTYNEPNKNGTTNPIVPLDDNDNRPTSIPNTNLPPVFNSQQVSSPYGRSPVPNGQVAPNGTMSHVNNPIGYNQITRYPIDYNNGQNFNSNDANLNNGMVMNNMPNASYPAPMVVPQNNQIHNLPDESMNGHSNVLSKHLANADQLETSYMAVNDEFWVNLLSTDSDKVNFTNNLNSNNWNSEEIFFMG